jgi:hypothetical protein
VAWAASRRAVASLALEAGSSVALAASRRGLANLSLVEPGAKSSVALAASRRATVPEVGSRPTAQAASRKVAASFEPEGGIRSVELAAGSSPGVVPG